MGGLKAGGGRRGVGGGGGGEGLVALHGSLDNPVDVDAQGLSIWGLGFWV